MIAISGEIGRLQKGILRVKLGFCQMNRGPRHSLQWNVTLVRVPRQTSLCFNFLPCKNRKNNTNFVCLLWRLDERVI